MRSSTAKRRSGNWSASFWCSRRTRPSAWKVMTNGTPSAEACSLIKAMRLLTKHLRAARGFDAHAGAGARADHQPERLLPVPGKPIDGEPRPGRLPGAFAQAPGFRRRAQQLAHEADH